MTTLLIATRNAHKVGEIQTILGQAFQCLTLDAYPGAPEVIEDADTFAGNATKKAAGLASWLAQTSGLAQPPQFVLADDSGLEVDALNGAPGVHSARFAALDTGKPGNSPTSENNAKLLRLMQGVPESRRGARFRCVLALTPAQRVAGSQASTYQQIEAQTQLFDGTCEGSIIPALKGTGGFGYDPLFIPAGYDKTFGELGEEIKNRLSHRAKALARMKAWFGQPRA